MSNDRVRKQLGELFDLEPGYAFKSGEFIFSGVPVIKIKNVKANQMLLDDLSFVDASFLSKRPNKIAQRGDLLITMSGNRIDGSVDMKWTPFFGPRGVVS
jgi:type I restriction enzyme, S subunit